jgi:subtilisin family serine protease
MPMPTAAKRGLAESSTYSVYAHHFGCNRNRQLFGSLQTIFLNYLKKIMLSTTNIPQKISPVEKPVQLTRPQFAASLIQAGSLIRASEARTKFSVTGNGLTVAVLDTGLRTTHVDFTGRVVAQSNFTTDNGGNQDDASDGHGHGTNVTGIIAANKLHIGIAPNAQVIPLKVLSNDNGGTFEAIQGGLQWVIDNRTRHNITAVCMSLGDGGNYTDDNLFSADDLRLKIQTLRNEKVAVVVAAGNDFFTYSSQQGMSYPAIFRETVSVGAVYDAREGGFSYSSGAVTTESAPDRITPFSQRLHTKINPITRTKIFAPGAPITSSGINNDQGESIQHGTSQATPVVTGVILLMQEYYLRLTGSLPSINELVVFLGAGGVRINDGDDEQDNVINTGLNFVRVDVIGALENITRRLEKVVFEEHKPLEEIYAD